MTIQELQDQYQFNKDTPIVIGDRCKVYFGKLNNEDEVVIISDLSPRVIQDEDVDSFEAGAVMSFNDTNEQESKDTFVFGSVQYVIRMLDNYSEEVINTVHQIIEEKDEEQLKELEIRLLKVLKLPILDRTQKLLDIKNLYKQGLYDETFKAIAYDYADDILLDGDMLYLLGDMCEKGMGTFQNKHQALKFFKRAQEIGITNADKRVEILENELKEESEAIQTEASATVDQQEDKSRLIRKNPPKNRKRGLSKKNKLRYSIIGSFSFIMGIIFTMLIGSFFNGSSTDGITASENSEEVSNDDVAENSNNEVFIKIEKDILKSTADLKNYDHAIKALEGVVSQIDQSLRVHTFTPDQVKRFDQIKGNVMGQISNLKDNESGNFTTWYNSKAGESVVAIANRYKIPEKNLFNEKGDNYPVDYTFKNGEKVKLKIPALFFDHKILVGESIGSISNKYDIQPEDIRKLNNLSSNVIHPGQTIRVYIRK
ncbi:LysM peptidoglycan-binding domain-containing protein [Flammeovirga sp. MY04]|uniref:LysM peptidoglycan-binding domain-containing protein n=1 Tax=Flammeovirga sp. MY04 TaxID=1191459 RepID=UPI00080637B1|nr:LysM peptidoglycan-binding domain-containing protein [Flammeovirga sp. MY04]ANQ48292.1 LysM peptidoglycan-binding domain-containing protein [Flammeovirga sp. MY04]